MSENEALTEMAYIRKKCSRYGWRQSDSEKYKDLMKIVGEDWRSFSCENYN